jgi:hypothetical protein
VGENRLGLVCNDMGGYMLFFGVVRVRVRVWAMIFERLLS